MDETLRFLRLYGWTEALVLSIKIEENRNGDQTTMQ